MIYQVDNFVVEKEKNTDCMINSLITALKYEGISLSASEIFLFSNGIAFNFHNMNKRDRVPVMGLLGTTDNLIEHFGSNCNIKISHYSCANKEEDYNIILDAIKNNHCVIAKVDKYGLAIELSRRLTKIIQKDNHMTQHYLIIHGIDTSTNRLLICETMLKAKSLDVWIEYDALEKARVCDWLNYGINRDIYVIEDTSCYIPPNGLKMLQSQIQTLKNETARGIDEISDFMNIFSNTDALSQRFVVATTKGLRMCLTGFDLSYCFYRGYLAESVSSCSSSKLLNQLYNDLASNWKKTANSIPREMDYTDCYRIWSNLLDTAYQELSTHKKALLLF